MSNKFNICNFYIIQEREFVNKNEGIYKIGRTSNLAKRICDYPKGSSSSLRSSLSSLGKA
jgi:hypothetical protein